MHYNIQVIIDIIIDLIVNVVTIMHSMTHSTAGILVLIGIYSLAVLSNHKTDFEIS